MNKETGKPQMDQLNKMDLLLWMAAQLMTEPDDFKEFSSLFLICYDHFQIGLDEALLANISNSL